MCKNFFIHKYFTNFASKKQITKSKVIMEIEGKIIAVLPPKEGVSSRTGNPWMTQDYVLETHDQYPRRCCFNVFGSDKIQLFNIQIGEELRVSFDIDAHEYQGRWFNSIRAWKVERIDPNAVQNNTMQDAPLIQPAPAQPAGITQPVGQAQEASPFSAPADGGSEDDLPF